MARPIKKGLDYFSFDVSFFEDKKVKVLKSRYGADGIIVYIYLLTMIYKEDGYYMAFDKDTEYVVSDDLNMNYKKIGQILNFLLERSLFSDTLFKSDKVLTSEGIQKRFQEAKKGSKKPIEVDKRFWILSKNDTQSHILCTDFQSYSKKNPDYSRKNPDYSQINDTKKRKEKKSKVKKSSNSITDAAFSIAIKNYEQNIGVPTPVIAQKIGDWLESVDVSLIEYAIEQAVLHNARNWSYISTIINTHFNAGRKSRADAETYGKKAAASPAKGNGSFNHDDLESITRRSN